jgi:elongation factor Ts
MAITAKDVKELREKTGAGMMDCKKALSAVDGDMEKAVDFLRTKGLAAVAKKQSRVAAEGLIGSFVANRVGALVEVNCETDFVAKNDDFMSFVSNAAQLVVAHKPADVKALRAIKTDSGATVEELMQELTLKIGEKIDVRRFSLFALESTGDVAIYVHTGKIGAMVEVATEKADTATTEGFVNFGKDVTMHVTACDARFLTSDEIDADYKERESKVYEAQLIEQGKPEKMIAGIIQGKMKKLASEICLYDQKFVKDPDFTIKTLSEKVSKELGDTIKITKFAKLVLGEGIEKKEDNLADEVAKLTKA